MSRTNYNKMSNRREPEVEKEVEVATPTVEEPAEAKVVEAPAPKVKRGIVTGCLLLNIRKKPSTSADILGTLSAGAEVIIHDEVGEFYKIGNPDGSEFCMKKYVTIKK